MERAPWRLAKTGHQDALDEVLYTAAESLRLVTALLSPVIPESTAKIWKQLGFANSIEDIRQSDLHWGHLKPGQHLGVVEGVFPRADAKVCIDQMRKLEEEEVARQAQILGKKPEPAAAAEAPKAPAASSESPNITIDDFVKVDLRVGIVKDAAPVKGADKLLHLHVDIEIGRAHV